MALAVSCTRQTTTAAISIGLPSASLTLACAVSWLRIRVETLMRRVNGLTHCSPVSRVVPRYLPNSWMTRASPGTTGVKPASSSMAAISTMTPAQIRAVAVPPACLPEYHSSAMAATTPTMPATRTLMPGVDQARCSATWAGATC